MYNQVKCHDRYVTCEERGSSVADNSYLSQGSRSRNTALPIQSLPIILTTRDTNSGRNRCGNSSSPPVRKTPERRGKYGDSKPRWFLCPRLRSRNRNFLTGPRTSPRTRRRPFRIRPSAPLIICHGGPLAATRTPLTPVRDRRVPPPFLSHLGVCAPDRCIRPRRAD